MSDFYSRSPDEQVCALRVLAKNALEQYDGQFSRPEPVKYRENAIFSVHNEGGERFALRVHRPNYHSDNALESELSWMQALARDGLPVPGLRLNSHGEAVTGAGTPLVPEMRKVDLLGWVPGEPLSKLSAKRDLPTREHVHLYRLLGRLMARLHEHGATWPRPAGFERHDWFTESLVGNEPLWGRFWDLPSLTADQKRTVLQAREEGADALSDYPRHQGNSGLIHADLIADNLMLDGNVIQPIDFDDAGLGWHVFDVATSLYFLMDRPDFPELRDALIAGYREVRSLPESEVEALPLFLMLRGTTYLGWVATRSETATARELAPELIQRACAACEAYRRSKG